jgi:hypothetical protein
VKTCRHCRLEKASRYFASRQSIYCKTCEPVAPPPPITPYAGELEAMRCAMDAIEPLPLDGKQRVLNYLHQRYGAEVTT